MLADHRGRVSPRIAGPGGVALLGDEAALRAQIRELESAGVTDFQAAPTEIEPGSAQRTVEFLASLGDVGSEG